MSVNGGVNLTVRGSRFESNVQEGLDCDDLVAPDNEEVFAVILDSRFAGNGTQGLDIDLAAPLFGGLTGGFSSLLIDHCVFELNLEEGALIDVDFEATPLWSAEIMLTAVTSRGNGGDGIHFDLDGPAPTLVHQVLCVGNGGDGILVSSETFAGLAVLSSTASMSNLGAGLRAFGGNTTLLGSHMLLAGNGAGGSVAESVQAGLTSTLTWLQDVPTTNTLFHASVTADDPTQPTLSRLPNLYSDVVAQDGATLTLAPGAPVPPTTDPVELQDDDVARTITGFGAGSDILVDPAPTFVTTPTRLAAFDRGDSVTEDYRVLPGSAAEGAGMTAEGEPPVNVGPLDSPSGGRPGVTADPVPALFWLASVAPPIATGLASNATLVLTFSGGELDPASVDTTSVVVRTAAGAVVSSAPFARDGDLHIPPPVGGWPAGGLLEIHDLLAATDGRALATPMALPLTVVP
jgi:hypothetical protein